MKPLIYLLFFGPIHEIIINVKCYYLHWMEYEHNPARFATNGPEFINGTPMPDWTTTPDYRVEEPPFLTYPKYGKYSYYEMLRPIRISPHLKQVSLWTSHGWYGRNIDYPERLGCYCTTVYKRFTLLAGCALITTRHALTTATSVELVLRKTNARKPGTSLIGILGFWYDHEKNYWNSSLYSNVARIAFHPRYMYPNEVNMTHPIPCVFDLAVLSTLQNVAYYACICWRGSSHWFEYAPSIPRPGEIMLIVGFQFVKAHKKKPMPWFKYVVRTASQKTCPKIEWGWFSCIEGQIWAKYGLESGAALHRALHHNRWVYDGLIGMNAFSMRLRSDQILHYFTVLDSHLVLDFLYDAYMGWMRYEYLDPRFANTQGGAPQTKSLWDRWDIYWNDPETWGEELYYGYDIPNYK